MIRPTKRANKAQPPVSGTTIVAEDGRVVHVGDVRIRKLLSELPVLPEMQEHIDAAVHGLTSIIVSSSGRDFPKSERTGTRLTLKELAAVGKLAAKLADQLERLHKESYDALSAYLSEEMSLKASTGILYKRRIDHPIESLRGKLVSLRDGAKEILFVVAKDKMIGAPRGARPRYEAARITTAAASVFERLTGLRVARLTERNPAGDFHLFLERVLEIAAIPINVDEQIRGWIANQASRRAPGHAG